MPSVSLSFCSLSEDLLSRAFLWLILFLCRSCCRRSSVFSFSFSDAVCFLIFLEPVRRSTFSGFCLTNVIPLSVLLQLIRSSRVFSFSFSDAVSFLVFLEPVRRATLSSFFFFFFANVISLSVLLQLIRRSRVFSFSFSDAVSFLIFLKPSEDLLS